MANFTPWVRQIIVSVLTSSRHHARGSAGCVARLSVLFDYCSRHYGLVVPKRFDLKFSYNYGDQARTHNQWAASGETAFTLCGLIAPTRTLACSTCRNLGSRLMGHAKRWWYSKWISKSSDEGVLILRRWRAVSQTPILVKKKNAVEENRKILATGPLSREEQGVLLSWLD